VSAKINAKSSDTCKIAKNAFQKLMYSTGVFTHCFNLISWNGCYNIFCVNGVVLQWCAFLL
jgi:hypothetical protein